METKLKNFRSEFTQVCSQCQIYFCVVFRPAFGCCAPQKWSKYSFSAFYVLKSRNNAKKINAFATKSCKKQFFKFAQKCWLTFFWGGGGNLQPAVWCKLKKAIFCKILQQICYFFAFFCFLTQKRMKMTISTSIWGVQHPIAGRNIQQCWLISLNLRVSSVTWKMV